MNRKAIQEKLEIIQKAIRIREEIEQIFTDTISWNNNARKEGEPPIDPDPDGKLAKMASALDKFIQANTQ